MSKRFITSKDNINISENNMTVYGNEVNHINVLRYKRGDSIYINEYMLEITNISKDELKGNITGKLEKNGEPNICIDMYVGYLKSDKMEYSVQKAVELGVKNIIPIVTKNTVVKLDDKDRIKKQERLQKIAVEATKQCGRTDDVKIGNILNISYIYNDMKQYALVIVCHEKETRSIQTVLSNIDKTNTKNIAVVIGPEGGLDESEVESIKKMKNTQVVSLGQRILRAETAVNYILSVLDYEFNG